MENIVVYTDGSCLGNPGSGGWAAIIIQNGNEFVLKGGQVSTTNNRMEMKAIIETVKWLSENVKDVPVDVYSDSSLIINSINEGWKRKVNLDLWEEFDKAMNSLKDVKIKWNWVKGHANNDLNNRVDKLAVNESKKLPQSGTINVQKLVDGYYCKNCDKKVNGVLSWMSDSKMIRVDCEKCGKYIMFAEKTPENIKKAKENVLLTKKQLEKVVEIKENRGEIVGENELKKLKKLTKEEANDFIISNQTLF
ncbi:ribonuclease HI [bacterium]|nr:ribonuclease HI [bacterium]